MLGSQLTPLRTSSGEVSRLLSRIFWKGGGGGGNTDMCSQNYPNVVC